MDSIESLHCQLSFWVFGLYWDTALLKSCPSRAEPIDLLFKMSQNIGFSRGCSEYKCIYYTWHLPHVHTRDVGDSWLARPTGLDKVTRGKDNAPHPSHQHWCIRMLHRRLHHHTAAACKVIAPVPEGNKTCQNMQVLSYHVNFFIQLLFFVCTSLSPFTERINLSLRESISRH